MNQESHLLSKSLASSEKGFSVLVKTKLFFSSRSVIAKTVDSGERRKIRLNFLVIMAHIHSSDIHRSFVNYI